LVGGGNLEPVDAERLDPELAPHEAHRSAGSGALDVLDMHYRIAHGQSVSRTFAPVLERVPPARNPAPDWLRARRARGRFEQFELRVLGRALPIRVWSPQTGALPLLIAHDGPEYAQRAGLTRYAGAMIERGSVAPFRLALLPPGDRNEWCSASANYGRSLCRRIIPAIADRVEVAGRPVGMGASLGALAMLQAQHAWPGTFAGLFLQSGSFFVPRFDRHESGFPRYGRIVRFVRRVSRSTGQDEPIPVTLTCGAAEENVHNNRLMAGGLVTQGYGASLAETAGGHDYPSWRAALDPHLTRLLAAVWGAR
jgi:enterochelin esterase family protein